MTVYQRWALAASPTGPAQAAAAELADAADWVPLDEADVVIALSGVWPPARRRCRCSA